MAGPHTQLIRARIAFSNSGLCAEHGYLARPASGKRVRAIEPYLNAKNIDTLHARDIGTYLVCEMEDRMLALAKELDALDAEYKALDVALYAESDAR